MSNDQIQINENKVKDESMEDLKQMFQRNFGFMQAQQVEQQITINRETDTDKAEKSSAVKTTIGVTSVIYLHVYTRSEVHSSC